MRIFILKCQAFRKHSCKKDSTKNRCRRVSETDLQKEHLLSWWCLFVCLFVVLFFSVLIYTFAILNLQQWLIDDKDYVCVLFIMNINYYF